MPSLSPISNSFLTRVSQRKSDAYLIELSADGRPIIDEIVADALGSEGRSVRQLAFQYWPETLSDAKAVTYQPKEIPGGSLPIYQWINGGERLITFQATFTTDVDLLGASAPPGLLSFSESGAGQIHERLKEAGLTRRNVDIRSAMAWLRSYMYPTYGASNLGNVVGGKDLTLAPPKLRLVMPNSGIGLAGATPETPDSVRCIMTQCDITVEQYFPNGLPRIATIDLAFAEVAQAGGTIKFPRRTAGMLREVDGGDQGRKTLGYNFIPKSRRGGS